MAKRIDCIAKKIEYIPYEIYSKLSKQSNGKDIGLTAEGTWGRSGAGLLIIHLKKEYELLLLKRSGSVMDPYLWSIPGGARKEINNTMENPLITAVSESLEEMRSVPKGRIRKEPYVYNQPNTIFNYHTFILEIYSPERENFIPALNWEHTGYGWFNKDELKKIKLHPGLENLLNNYKF